MTSHFSDSTSTAFSTPNNPNDNAARFHIHAAAAGQNGGIQFGMKDPNHDVDDLVINPVTGRITGVWDGTEGNGTTLTAQLPILLTNRLYFNVHTPDFTGGEIRGQIILVPEPGTFACAQSRAQHSLELRDAAESLAANHRREKQSISSRTSRVASSRALAGPAERVFGQHRVN